MTNLQTDVVVIGAGNAALCAALSASKQGARVMVLECAPEDERGGNSRYTAGAMRVVFNRVEDLQKVMDLTPDEIAGTDFGSYSFDQYFDDTARVTRYRANPDLVEILVRESLDTMVWIRSRGVRFQPAYGRQAFKIDGRFRFLGGLAVETWGGGPGLVGGLFYFNCPGGTGLMSGAVFGRITGCSAGAAAVA